MLSKDFYGNDIVWFTGVVKDVEDPNNSNRVRVHILGIHPGDPTDGRVTPGTNTGGTTTPGSGGGGTGTGTTTGGGTVTPSNQIPTLGLLPAKNPLPNASQLDAKISNHFTLRQLTVGVTGSAASSTSRRGIDQGKLTPEIIKNLSTLAVNCLDPIKDHFGNIQIHGAWRLDYSKADRGASKNHPSGYSCDFHVQGASNQAVVAWIKSNLKGRFNMMLYYSWGIHIQVGSNTGRQGSLDNPLIKAG